MLGLLKPLHFVLNSSDKFVIFIRINVPVRLEIMTDQPQRIRPIDVKEPDNEKQIAG